MTNSKDAKRQKRIAFAKEILKGAITEESEELTLAEGITISDFKMAFYELKEEVFAEKMRKFEVQEIKRLRELGSNFYPQQIQGYCPMGCGQTLTLAIKGRVVCGNMHCPQPYAITDLFNDKETEHIVVVTAKRFTTRHPMRERLNDDLLGCELDEVLSGFTVMPVPQTGKYRMSLEPVPKPGQDGPRYLLKYERLEE